MDISISIIAINTIIIIIIICIMISAIIIQRYLVLQGNISEMLNLYMS